MNTGGQTSVDTHKCAFVVVQLWPDAVADAAACFLHIKHVLFSRSPAERQLSRLKQLFSSFTAQRFESIADLILKAPNLKFQNQNEPKVRNDLPCSGVTTLRLSPLCNSIDFITIFSFFHPPLPSTLSWLSCSISWVPLDCYHIGLSPVVWGDMDSVMMILRV